MIRVADREVETDHAGLGHHARVERGRAGVIRMHRADPGGAGGFCFLNGQRGGALHHQVAHAVVAVDQRHRRALGGDADVRREIDTTRLEAPDVGDEADHTVTVRALAISLGHQLAHGARVGFGQAGFFKRGGDEGAEGGLGGAEGLGHLLNQ
jgi:hypothetical protein